MTMPLIKAWTQQEFFDWEGHGEGRWEFDGVRPVAMTGGSINHNRIILNVHVALRVRLQGGRCEPLGPDAGVETVGQAVRYPDAVVTCSKTAGEAYLVREPVVLFDVVSPGSVREDHFVKFREYAGVATVRRYVIVETGFAGVTVHERSDAAAHWATTALTAEDVLAMPEIGVEIPVSEFYVGIDLPETKKQAAP
jgi:Uma2 family endonuclease